MGDPILLSPTGLLILMTAPAFLALLIVHDFVRRVVIPRAWTVGEHVERRRTRLWVLALATNLEREHLDMSGRAERNDLTPQEAHLLARELLGIAGRLERSEHVRAVREGLESDLWPDPPTIS